LREALDAFFTKSQEFVTAPSRSRSYKGNLTVKVALRLTACIRPTSRRFDTGNYNHHDAEGFVSLWDSRSRTFKALSRKI
jgi:argininosuccinate synthase